jgi:hypothetical protein
VSNSKEIQFLLSIRSKVIKFVDFSFCAGKHYIHMDEAELMADKIVAFLKKSEEAKSVDGNKL